jgi:flagellar basal body L-ring protein FlgH
MNKKERLLKEHNQWLLSKGVSAQKPRKPKGIYKLPDLSVRKNANTSDIIGNGYAKQSNSYSGSRTVCVGQAYHKGNLVVLSAEDAKNSSTGKRR